jgi:UDP-GlcNAc:undecaprenyl-phosphate GlcNAc-1-phosphate transferase
MQYLLPGITSFLVTIIITPIVIHFATACKCLDVPGRRHIHKKSTPLWGGMAFILGVMPVVFIFDKGSFVISYIAASCIVVGSGIIDDCYKIGWRMKPGTGVA